MSVRDWFSRVTGLFRKNIHQSLDPQLYFQQIIENVHIESADAFDRNFERKAFFDDMGSETRIQNQNGSLLLRSGHLHSSINSTIQSDDIVFTSNLSYANIHNERGEITVMPKIQKFFWVKYYETKTRADRLNT